VVWLTTRSDKSTVATFARVAWRTVGAMCQRVADQKLDPGRPEGLAEVGVDEISWRKHHQYLTLVSDHALSTIVWGHCGEERGRVGPVLRRPARRRRRGARGGLDGPRPGVRQDRPGQSTAGDDLFRPIPRHQTRR